MPVVLQLDLYGVWLHEAGEEGRGVLAANVVPAGWQKTKLPAKEEGPKPKYSQGELL